MKNKRNSVLAALFLGTSLFLASCTGENTEMPPESTHGNTQETGVEGTGDLPGTGAEDTTITGTQAGTPEEQ
ncbi:hypothetical protein [Botryobacter ruber]|uniref:hypothetical protein n=1 Tax=Botryobacter ruber TaxID=2171629 RepID=UPI000E0BACC2|nr:hypothetical protein [Botryobacter ruber]